ncbi:MAG: hypothetical protein ACNA7K_02555 [Acholeplasmataceae bacterium]
MRLSDVLGVRRNLLRRRILTLGVIITGALSIAFTLITFYGQNAGNFIMTVDQDALRRGINLSEEPDFNVPTSRLMTNPVSEARDLTYSWLKFDEIMATNGQYFDPDYEYIAYTFYIRNTGSETVDVHYNIRISDVYKNLDEAVRFLVIEDDTIFRMYQKPDRLIDGELPEYFLLPDPFYFNTNSTVMRHVIENFRPGQTKKFSIVIWLEGQDPDTNDDVLGGMMKAHMNFTIRIEE